MAQILSIKVDGNFKRNVENKLNKWGYQYNYSRNSIEIVKAPEGAAARLTEIMIREFKLDIQIDSLAFACFIKAFDECDSFECMPWSEREAMIRAVYRVNVSERTLRSWSNRLIERGLLVKGVGERAVWRTVGVKESARRELVTGDEELEAEACAYWKDMRAARIKYNDNKKAFNEVYNKYGCCYYVCKGFDLSAFDRNTELFQEIYELVEEIINK